MKPKTRITLQDLKQPGMTHSQIVACKQIVYQVNLHDLHGISDSRKYEIKQISVEQEVGNNFFIKIETGLTGDENTMAEVFGRTRRMIFIGKCGGLRAYGKGRWVRGKYAPFTIY